MKRNLFNKIALTKKSNNTIQEKENKIENNLKKKKSTKNTKNIVPKINTNLFRRNEKDKEKEKYKDKDKEQLFARLITNINLYNNKEKKLLLNSINNTSNKSININNINNQKLINDAEKDDLCNTDRSSHKRNNKENNFQTYANHNSNKSIKLLLSAKNVSKKDIFKKKNIVSDEEKCITEFSNDYKIYTISKNKSTKFFSKIKVTKNNRNETNEKNIINNCFDYKSKSKNKKNIDIKKSLDTLENGSLVNTFFSSNKSFNDRNSTSSSGIKIKRCGKTLNKKKNNLESNDLNNLDVIFEDNKKKNNGETHQNHHYLENTISAKNKMVRKRTTTTGVLTINDDEKYIKVNNNKFLRKKINNFLIKESDKEKTRNNKFKSNNIHSYKKLSDNNLINRISVNNLKNRTKSIDTFNKNNNNNHMSTDNIKIFNGKIEDYLITKELGKGSCAVVKLATHKITKDKFAIKIYTKEFLLDPQKRNVVKNEINILKQLDNEYIMKLYEEIDTPNYLYLVMEYINGIPLIDLLNNENKCMISQERATKLIIQIIKGVIYLHSKHICHRDIKLENILVMKNDIIKIIDFGFAVKCNKDSYQKLFCGTPSYMAPEILNKKKYSPYYSDIWSLGVLFYAMIYGKFPFDYNNKDIDDEFEEITAINIKYYDEINANENIINIFKRIFILEPKERVSLNEILDILSKNIKISN